MGKKIERDWDKFGDYKDEVIDLVKQMGFTPVYPPEIKPGIRVKLKFNPNKYGIVKEVDRDSNIVELWMDYYTRSPFTQLVRLDAIEPNPRC